MSANQQFKQYMAALEGSGLPAVQAHLAYLNGLSRNERFQWFCANRLGQTATATTPARKASSKNDALQARIDELETLVAKLVGGEVKTPAPKTEAKPAPVATRISWPMAITLIKGGIGDVQITGKKGQGRTADYALTLDGQKLTPAKASELIAAIKSR